MTARAIEGCGERNIRRIALGLVLLMAISIGAGAARASDPMGIYALVDKVVLEPNEDKPERIQIWGTFCFAEGRGETYAQPKRGYLYYKLNPDKPDVSRKEWSDLKSVAGTSQVIAFASRHKEKGDIRQAADKAKGADVYPLGLGLQKIREDHYNSGPVKALRTYASKNARLTPSQGAARYAFCRIRN